MRDRSTRPGNARRRPGAAAPTPAAGRPGARPTSSRRPNARGPGGTTRTSAPRPRGRFTARAVVLGFVLAALGLSYVFPLRVYLAQQAEIAELRAAQEQQRSHVADLEAEAALWSDDDYIRIQARRRLYFGEPGEQLLIVPEEDQPPPETGFDPDDVPAPPEIWWDTLWLSIQSASEGPAEPEPPAPGDDADPADPSLPEPEESP
ncbi:septum formation initiator family protein [Natronosporangium hydrolyticum]|uniref:Septum formation initiator family protein n=1 Tax=Natronosporangium hydrolyticum TaxID=2811111 RepID=A0A895YDK1_9ACTN|nr:septum formation initiator family protein [Natronosporangium hydrolyticum]QSB14265.1 septum formation initiator family protein [Natronosporangium hydrolyticum]